MKPNYFLVGTTKGGTSSLDLWLRGHPGVATPERKEMHFFCHCPNPKLRVAKTRVEYLAAFPAGEAIGESSPCYMYYDDIPGQLAAFRGARVIMSLRDPTERFWSHYLMNEIYRPTHLEAEAVLDRNLEQGRSNALDDLFGVGLYGDQVERYLSSFDREMILILFLEETSADPGEAVAKVQSFLGLSPYTLDTSAVDKQHVEPRGLISQVLLRNHAMRRLGNLLLSPGVRRLLKTRLLGDPDAKPTMPEDLRRRLHDLYVDDSRRLESLLGRSLPWTWHR